MNITQIVKLLKLAIVAVAAMFLFEIIFAIPGVTEGISNWVTGMDNKWLLWSALWFIMFIQVSIVPIPAYVVLNTALYAKLIDPTNGLFNMFGSQDLWIFMLVTMSAYMTGASLAYLMGRRWGRRAVTWCAGSEEGYDKWASVFNEKGKKAYAATIIFPCFPDDLLCLVAGSIKLDFGFFFIWNFIGRSVGLLCSVGALALIQSATQSDIPWAMIGWGILFILIIVLDRILTLKINKSNREEKGE